MKTTLPDKFKILSRGSSWRKVRNKHIKKEPYCQICGCESNLEVHHFLPWKSYPELRLDDRNLVTLCRHCHFRFGHFSSWKDANESLSRQMPRLKETYADEMRARRKVKLSNILMYKGHSFSI